MRGALPGMLLIGLALQAHAGEIVIIDPAREKARAQPPAAAPRHDDLRGRVLDEARLRSGREPAPSVHILGDEGEAPPPAIERAREARGYIDEGAVPPAPTLILRNAAPPPSDASQAREKARAWVTPPSGSPNRCKTENTVGGIDGAAQGHTVIQSNTSGVTAICK